MDYMPLPKAGRIWKSKADFFRPFRAAAAEAGESISPLYDPLLQHKLEDEPDLKDLNTALATLIDVFPEIEPEAFREMLLNVSEESRVEVVTEQLLKKNAKWTRGRYRIARKIPAQTTSVTQQAQHGGEPPLAVEDTFRGEAYRKAVKEVFYVEFRNLSHSTIKAVMAEHNHSYTLSRPVLQQLAARSWRFSLSTLWPKRTAIPATGDHPNIVWPSNVESAVPGLKRTGSAQLDQELYDLLVRPLVEKHKQEMLRADQALASQLNEEEALEAQALYECECCYCSVPFEQTVTCNNACHQLCFDCVRRTLNEALYGQGWARTADLERSTVRCFASDDCFGILPADRVEHALSFADQSQDIWSEYQTRIATEILIKSGLSLQRCPFCTYAEVDETPPIKLRTWRAIWQHIVHRTTPAIQMMFLSVLSGLLFFTVPLLLLAIVVWLLMQIFPPLGAVIDASWARVRKERSSLKFRCRNPACRKTSCTRCTAVWRDPHTCFETEKTSLRTAIESSATAAIKRTCPRCLLSFVKASGCNKLVCNCGYTMCYICRHEITSKEGYSHFCQHFRPHGGRCSECEKCDLYGDEDEEAAIRRAAEAAEKVWREREGGKEGDEKVTQLMVDALVGRARHERGYEQFLDAIIDAIAS